MTPEAPKSTTTQPSKSTAQESKKIAPESKATAPVSKSANTTAKAVKTKKQPEPIVDTDEVPTKRVTRAHMRECNIVLEKLIPGEPVESVTYDSPQKDVKGKRKSNEAPVESTKAKKAKRSIAKNINPEFHSLKKLVDCQICDKPAKLSLVNHYVNLHPNAEVVTSRLAPDVADALRNAKDVEVAKRIKQHGRNYFEISHYCHFCNATKTLMNKTYWINHLAKHTGYYQYKCNDCPRRFAEKNKSHACKGNKNNLSSIPQPQFSSNTLKAYLCDICNFIRFNQSEIEKHLRCEHELDVADRFKEVIFMKFPSRGRKSQIELQEMEELEDLEEEESESSSDSSDEEIINTKPKRRKLSTNSEKKDKDPESSPEKVDHTRVVHSEAFISEPKQDDGLFDKDTMKLMKDMSFSASKDGEPTNRPNRAKSIAEKLSERFNSVQADIPCKLEEKQAKIEPLDPMTCDEGIPIIRVEAIDECPAKETNTNTAKGM